MSFIKIGTALSNFISQINPTKFHNKGWVFAHVGEWIGNLFTAFGQLFVTWFYWICKWLLAFVDFLQYFIQKLIGLDYWLNNNAYTLSGATKNDILFSFLFDDTVQRVFRAMIAIFAVLLILFTIVAIIRQEWQYITGEKFGDGRSNSKASIIKNSLKAIALVLVFPLILGVGIISSNAILASLVKALNIDMASTFGGTIFYISTQSANKYRDYADSDARVATSDQVTFYMVNKDLNGNDIDPKNSKRKYLLKLGGAPYGPNNEKGHYVVNYKDYLEFINSRNGYAEKFTVNAIFDAINPKNEGNFSGFCIGLNVDGTRYYYMVRANSDKSVGMYYYLKYVLNAEIMTSESNIGSSSIQSDLRSSFSQIDGESCYISNLNLNDFGAKSGVITACYNTWYYSTVYMQSFGFGASENSVNVNNAIDSTGGFGFLDKLGLSNFSSLRVIYNNDIISPYFDGGQLGNVQLQSEYYVMADIIDFIVQTDCTLYMIDATSSSIDWKYQGNSADGYHVDTRWISSTEKTDGTHNYDSTYNSLPLVVSYSEECENEFGNVLYMANKGVSNEVDGSTYIMCWKVSNGGTSKYIPVVNGKSYTDPSTGNTYNFKSDYYTSNYRGVVVAKGTFDTDVNSTNAKRGNPTYLKSSVNIEDGKDKISISESDPYYYEMAESGGINQTIEPITSASFEASSKFISNISANVETSTTYELDYDTGDDNVRWYKFRSKNAEGGVVEDRVTLSSTIMQSLSISMYLLDSNNQKIITSASYDNIKQSVTEKGVTYTDYLYLTYDGFYTIVRADFNNNRFTICNMYVEGGEVKYSPIVPSDQMEKEPTVQLQTINYTVQVNYDYTDNGIHYSGIFNDLKLKPRDFTYSSASVKDGVNTYLFRTTDAQGVTFKESDSNGTTKPDGKTMTKYEIMNFYFDSSNLISLSQNTSDADVKGRITFANRSVGTSNSVITYGNKYYTFYLYNFYTGAVGNSSNYTLKKYDSDSQKISSDVVSRPTDDEFKFTIKVNQDNFYWDDRNTSYGLYNGNIYVATVYKNINTSVGSIDVLPSTTTSVLYNGKTYYNVITTNRFDTDDNMVLNYNNIRESFMTGCYRDNADYNAARSDFEFRIKWLFSSNVRLRISFGNMDMSRGNISTYFKLDEGLTFDYFFSNRVNLDTFYIPSSISYWIIVIASILIIKVLGQAIWGVIKRFYEITLYFLAMPAVASTIPLDGGQRFKSSIQQPLFKKVLSTYGVILGINVFFVLLAPVKSISNIFTAEDIATSGSYFLQHLPFNYKVLNLYVYILFILVAFTMINTLPSTISTLVGGDDVHDEGGKVRKQAGEALSSAGKTFSGRGLMEGVGTAFKGAKDMVPGGALVAGAAKGGKGLYDWAKNKAGQGEGFEGGNGTGEEKGDKTDASREDGDEETEGGVEGSVENAEATAGGESSGSSAAVKDMTGMDSSVMENGTDAQKAAYQAAQSMVGVTDDEMESMAAQEFNEKMTTKANDVVGSDFNAGAATAAAVRNGVGAGNAAFAGVAAGFVNKADNAAKADAIRSTLSGDELDKFNQEYEKDADAALAAHQIDANPDGTVKVDGKMAGAAASKAMLESAINNADVNEINDALKNDAGASAAANSMVVDNLASVADMNSGLGQRILDIANQDQGMKDEAMFNYFNGLDGNSAEKKKFAESYSIAMDENGQLNKEQAMLAIQNNRDNIKPKDQEKLSQAMTDVIRDKAASGEFKVTAWDLQKGADDSVTADLVAKKKAEWKNYGEHNILEGATTAEKAQILDNVANALSSADPNSELAKKIAEAQQNALNNHNSENGATQLSSFADLSDAERVKAFADANLTELFARTATIDKSLATDANGNLINTHFEANQRTPRTEEEERAEKELSVEAILKDSPESILNAFSNSNVDNKNAIAVGAIQDFVKDSKFTDEKALAEVAKTMNLGDLNLQGFSNEDIALAFKTAEKLGDTKNLQEYLNNINENPSKIIDKLKDKDNVNEFILSRLTDEQMNQLAGDSVKGLVGFDANSQSDVLAKLALQDGSIIDKMKEANIDIANNKEVSDWINNNESVKADLVGKAGNMSYLEIKGLLNGESNESIDKKIQERAAKNKTIDDLMAAESVNVDINDAKSMLDSSSDSVKKAFIDEFIDKSDIINVDDQERIRNNAVREYLRKQGKNPSATDIADALANDAGAMNAADEAVLNEAKNRIALGLGGRNDFVAEAVRNDSSVYKKALKEFRRQNPGLELEDADLLTQNAFLAKFESQLGSETSGVINEKYLQSLQKTNVIKSNEEYNKLLKHLSNNNITGSEVDKNIISVLGLKSSGNIDDKVLNTLKGNENSFNSVYDSLNRLHGQEGADIINNLKRSYLSQQLEKGSIDIALNTENMSSKDKRDFDYNKGMLTQQVLQEGRTDLLENIFKNTNILNKDKILKEVSDDKGNLDSSKFNDYISKHPELQNKLLALGAADITRSLDNNTLEQKNVEAVKASNGLKNELLDYIKNQIKNIDNDDSKTKKEKDKLINDLINNYDIKAGANIDKLEFNDIGDKGLSKAINENINSSATFRKSVHDNVVANVSYAGNASEEEKQRFFDTEAVNLSPSKVEGVVKKAKNMKEALELFAQENGGGVGGVAMGAMRGVGHGFATLGKGIKDGTAHAFKGFLFKVTKQAPKNSTAYDNWNRELQMQINAVEGNNLLTRAEKDAQIKVIEAKKVRYNDPKNFSNMSIEEQQAYKKQQAQNRQEAFEAGNFNFVKKVGSAVKSVKDAHVLKTVASNIGYSMRFSPFQTEESKLKRKQDMINAKSDIDRYNVGKAMRRADTFSDDEKFKKFAASYGMSEKKIEKMLSGNAEERQKALEHALNIRYRVASKKVAKDNKTSPKSYFDGHGIGEENKVYREANKKFLEVKSNIHTPTALKVLLPGVSQAAFAIARRATTDSRMRAINKYESDPNAASARLAKRYDKIYGRRTDESVIKAHNDVINAKNMMAEMQKFNTDFKGDKNKYMTELYDMLSKKFGQELTDRMMKKIGNKKDGFTITNSSSLRTKQGWFAGGDKAVDLSQYALSIQKREVEKILMEQLNQNKRRTQLGSRAIPAPSSAAGEFIGKTMTNAKTQTELNRDKANAEHLNKLFNQINSQKNVSTFKAATSSIDSITMEKFMKKHGKELSFLNEGRKLSDAENAQCFDVFQKFLRKELEKANNRVHNNGFAKSRKSELEKLNGIYIDRKEINHSGLSASMMTAIKTQNSEVYKNLTKQYNSANARQLSEQVNYNQLARSLKNLQNMPMSSEVRKEIAKTKRAIAESEIKLRNLKTLVDQTKSRKVDYEKAFADKQIKQAKTENRNVGYNTSTRITDRYTVPYRRDGVQGRVIPGSQLEREVNRLMSQFIQAHKSELQKLKTQNLDAQDIKRIVDNASYRLSNDFKQNLYNNKTLIKSIERKLKSDIEKGVSKNRKTNENLNDTKKKLVQMEDQLRLELKKLGIELDDIKLKTDK